MNENNKFDVVGTNIAEMTLGHGISRIWVL